MIGFGIWWIIVGFVTWPVVIVAFAYATYSKYDGDKHIYDVIGDLWLDGYVQSMIPKFLRNTKNCILQLFGVVWVAVCVGICWPFDRFAMYMHWKDACRSIDSQREREGS